MKVAGSCARRCRSGHRDLHGEPDWALVMGIGSRSASRHRELGQEAPEDCPAGTKPSLEIGEPRPSDYLAPPAMPIHRGVLAAYCRQSRPKRAANAASSGLAARFNATANTPVRAARRGSAKSRVQPAQMTTSDT